MKIVLCVLMILISTTALSSMKESKVQFREVVIHDEESSKYLKDLPPLNSENMRWFIPSDMWISYKQYEMKGKYFSIIIDSEKGYRGDVYDSSKLEKEPFVKISGNNYEFPNRLYDCYKTSPRRKVARYVKCTFMNCSDTIEESDDKYKFDYFQSDYIKLVKGQFTDEKCPTYIDMVQRAELESWDEGEINYTETYNFRVNNIDPYGNYLEIPIGNEKKYLDIRFCKKNPSKCQIVDYKLSDYEASWVKLKQLQERKSYEPFNDLLKYLKPCVEAENIECIKQYLTSKEDADYQSIVIKPISEVDEELLKELKACLNYDNLLPHLLGSKGIKKVCVFTTQHGTYLWKKRPPKGRTKIIAVIYPEGVMEGNGSGLVEIK